MRLILTGLFGKLDITGNKRMRVPHNISRDAYNNFFKKSKVK